MHEYPQFDEVPVPSRRRGERALAVTASLLLLAGVAAAVARGEGPAGLVQVPTPADVPVDLAPPAAISQEQAARARLDAGCTVLVNGEPLTNRDHLDAREAPPAAALYPDPRPAHSGQHFSGVLPLPDRVAAAPIDERAVLHNMEHGSVVVWFDPDQVTTPMIGEVQDWLRERLALGFVSDSAGGIFASPSEDITSGRAFALRAWGVAIDCDRFDRTAADAFLQDHWGSHGASPEAHLSPFPPGVLGGVGTFV